MTTDADKVDKVSKSVESESKKVATSRSTTTDFEDQLTCAICQELFHKCCTLTPCNHWLCAACISQWLEKSAGMYVYI
jgi:hypothetical protein